MKISKEQKAENRRLIIQAAVELIAEKAYQAATMRGIARQANIGEATIYNYFPTKEGILYGFYEDHMTSCIEALKAVEDFHTFSLQEQLQTLFDTSLALLLENRSFVAITFPMVLLGPSRDWARIRPIRTTFLTAVTDMVDAAVEVGEIPEQVFQELLGQFFMDAYIGVVHYWLADTSEGFSNTSILLDRGLDMACAFLKADLANKVFDMASFLFKTHILSRLDRFAEPMVNTDTVKRRFMEATDE